MVSNVSWGLTEWTTPHHPLKCIAALSGLVGLPPKSPIKGDNKVQLFMGMAPRLKTVSNLSLGFPEYGMTNASNSSWGFPLPSTPKGVEKGIFIYKNDDTTKTVSNLSLGFPIE